MMHLCCLVPIRASVLLLDAGASVKCYIKEGASALISLPLILHIHTNWNKSVFLKSLTQDHGQEFRITEDICPSPARARAF